MKNYKIILSFLLGILVGGVIVGIQGVPLIQAGSTNLPDDLFYLQMSYPDKQRYCIRSQYQEKYKVARAGKTADKCILGYISN